MPEQSVLFKNIFDQRAVALVADETGIFDLRVTATRVANVRRVYKPAQTWRRVGGRRCEYYDST